MQKKYVFRLISGAVVAVVAVVSTIAAAQVPPGYPADYAKIIEDGKKEGKVVVLSTTDAKEAAPLIKDFSALYPGIKVEYTKMNSTDIFERFSAGATTRDTATDVLWSSAMDLQVKLASDGQALPYKTAELAAMPSWAVLNNMAYGTTYEPIVIVYNKQKLAASEVPATRADLMALLTKNPEKFKNKITTYDNEKSGVGFLFLTQDVRENPKFWDLSKAFGAAGVQLLTNTDKMLDRVSSGEDLIGYNVIASYAKARAKKEASLGVAFLKDYTVVLSRVIFISKEGQHPNAAKLWLDYILSKRAQTIIANDIEMYSIRSDVTGETTAAGLVTQLGSALRPIAVNAFLLRYLDQTRKKALLKEWKTTLDKK